MSLTTLSTFAKPSAMQLIDDEKKMLLCAKYQLEKNASPITWTRTISGIKIVDMLYSDIERVVAFVEKWHVPNDILCRLSKLSDDPSSLSYYLKCLESTLQQGHSLIAVDRDKSLLGVLVLNIVEKLDFGRVYSHETLTHGDAYTRYLQIRTDLLRNFDAYIEYGRDVFLRFHLVCTVPHLGHEDLAYLLLKSGLDVAAAYGVSVAVGIFTNVPVQRTAERLGFKKVRGFEYGEYFDGFDSDEEDGTRACELMAAKGFVEQPPMSSESDRHEREVQTKKKGKSIN